MMKTILATLFIAVSLLACFAQNISLRFSRLRPGDSAPITFRAYRPFIFDQAKAFGGKRNLALSKYVPLYIFSRGAVDSGKKQMAALLAALSVPPGGTPMDAGAFAARVKKEFAVALAPDEAVRLMGYPGLQNLLEGMRAICNSVLESLILKEPGPLEEKAAAEVRYPEPMGTVTYPSARFLTVNEARDLLRKQAEKIFWQVDPKVLGEVVKIASATITPNLIYDQKENERRIEEIIQRYPSNSIRYGSGQVLVPARKIITEQDELLIAANRRAERADFLSNVSWVGLAVVMLTVLYVLTLSKVCGNRKGFGQPQSIHFTVLILSILVFEAALLLTPLPVYFLPIAFVPLLLVLLGRRPGPAAATTLMAAVIAALISGRSVQMLIYFLIGGLTALLCSGKIRKRSRLLVPCFAAGAVCALMALSFGLDWQSLGQVIPARLNSGSFLPDPSRFGLVRNACWAVAGGLAAAPLAAALLPVLELTLRASSTIQISAWTNLEHPILKELLSRAPGTYQHVMSVANIASAAGEAVGANVALLRAGVYYHDIGKMFAPAYFTENQANGINPHDGLMPAESARIIIDHVKKGLITGKKAKLPKEILDFIPQHHGTMILECFWDKANHGVETPPVEVDFRYSGPVPQSKEAAILMVADAAEAASRTLPERSRAAVEALVRHIIEKRMNDGQFDECDLTTEELALIRNSLIEALAAVFHSRVVYPWQEQTEGSE